VKKLAYNLTDDSDRSSVVTTIYGLSPTTSSYTSNNVHEYTVVGGVNRTYDDAGNLTDDGTFEYTYDYRNQMLTATRKSNSHCEGAYEYDALGRRTKKTLYDTSSARYYHDDLHEIEEYDGSGNVLRKYVYRDEIDSIAMMEAKDVADVDNDANTTELVRLYYHYDSRSNGARLTAAAQTVVEAYEYDPYGNVSIKDKSGGVVSSTQVGNPFDFQRRRRDIETGHMYFRARQYSPEMGSWLQRDPLGLTPGPNWHEAFVSNPTGNLDPMGLDNPGCDVPGKLTDPCLLDCCAEHDNCYSNNGCTQASWNGSEGWPCMKCNDRVSLCVILCSKLSRKLVRWIMDNAYPPVDDAPCGWLFKKGKGFYKAPCLRRFTIINGEKQWGDPGKIYPGLFIPPGLPLGMIGDYRFSPRDEGPSSIHPQRSSLETVSHNKGPSCGSLSLQRGSLGEVGRLWMLPLGGQ
jgi:RHS repeat-associated protein